MGANRLSHVAIIMDGNGRWAAQRGLPRIAGHRAGARALREVVRSSRELGIRYLTLYALSSENWHRPAAELRGLMSLLSRFLLSESDSLVRHQIELHAIGHMDRLPDGPRGLLGEVIAATRGLGGMRLTLALSYGGRDEIARALRTIAVDLNAGRVTAADIDEAFISRHLDTADTPDPDLIVRTGGEHRLSNFLLWQSAYSELHVSDVWWPDFGSSELVAALNWYHGRSRRFGRVAAG